MKKNDFVMLAAMAICLVSCGGKSTSGNAENETEELMLKTQFSGSNFTDFASFPEEVKIKKASDQPDDGDYVNLVLSIPLDVKTAFCGDGNSWTFDLSIVDKDYVELEKLDDLYYGLETEEDDDYDDVFRFYMKKGIIHKSINVSVSVRKWEEINKNGALLIISETDVTGNGYKAILGKGSCDTNNSSTDDKHKITCNILQPTRCRP